MKSLLIAIPIISMTLISLSCLHTNSGTLNYDRLHYDTNRVAIFKWDTTKYHFPNSSDPLPLTQEDLIIIDSLLKDAVDSFNTQISPRMYESFGSKVSIDSFIIKQEKYRYQFFPFRDVNGQRVMTIIGFSTDFHLWKTEMYHPKLHYGMRTLELQVNLSKKIHDNIHSGDFG